MISSLIPLPLPPRPEKSRRLRQLALLTSAFGSKPDDPFAFTDVSEVPTTDIRDDGSGSPHGQIRAAGSSALLLRGDALNLNGDRSTDRVAHRRMLLRVGQEIIQLLV